MRNLVKFNQKIFAFIFSSLVFLILPSCSLSFPKVGSPEIPPIDQQIADKTLPPNNQNSTTDASTLSKPDNTPLGGGGNANNNNLANGNGNGNNPVGGGGNANNNNPANGNGNGNNPVGGGGNANNNNLANGNGNGNNPVGGGGNANNNNPANGNGNGNNPVGGGGNANNNNPANGNGNGNNPVGGGGNVNNNNPANGNGNGNNPVGGGGNANNNNPANGNENNAGNGGGNANNNNPANGNRNGNNPVGGGGNANNNNPANGNGNNAGNGGGNANNNNPANGNRNGNNPVGGGGNVNNNNPANGNGNGNNPVGGGGNANNNNPANGNGNNAGNGGGNANNNNAGNGNGNNAGNGGGNANNNNPANGNGNGNNPVGGGGNANNNNPATGNGNNAGNGGGNANNNNPANGNGNGNNAGNGGGNANNNNPANGNGNNAGNGDGNANNNNAGNGNGNNAVGGGGNANNNNAGNGNGNNAGNGDGNANNNNPATGDNNKTKFVLSFDYTGGLGDTTSLIDLSFSQVVALPIGDRTDYKLKGWSSTRLGDIISGGNYTMPNRDINLYAQWEIVNNTLRFDLNAGNVNEPIADKKFPVELDPNDPKRTVNISSLSTPTRSGYVFVGWSSSQNGPISDVINGTLTMPKANVTLYARYCSTNADDADRCADSDGNGLIEIASIENLNSIRYNLQGTSWNKTASSKGDSTGCPNKVCFGYELTKDLDFNNTKWGADCNRNCNSNGWEPIAWRNEGDGFHATFDGHGFSISNIYSKRAGLFGRVSGVVRNLGLSGGYVSINNASDIIGGIATDLYSNGSLESVYASVSVYGKTDVGGLVGYIEKGSIKNSYFIGSIRIFSGTSFNNLGGLVGRIQNGGEIINSYAYGDAHFNCDYSFNVGGLIGAIGKVRLQNVDAKLSGSLKIANVFGGLTLFDSSNDSSTFEDCSGLIGNVGQASLIRDQVTFENQSFYVTSANFNPDSYHGIGNGRGLKDIEENVVWRSLYDMQVSIEPYDRWATVASWNLLSRNRLGFPAIKDPVTNRRIEGQGYAYLYKFASDYPIPSLPPSRYYEENTNFTLPVGVTAWDSVKGSYKLVYWREKLKGAFDNERRFSKDKLTVTVWNLEDSFGEYNAYWCNLNVNASDRCADVDGNGLIEVANLEDLNNMRYSTQYIVRRATADNQNFSDQDFAGCPGDNAECNGYELVNDLDFSGTKWASNCTGSCVSGGWVPICGGDDVSCVDKFVANLEGNGHTISNLYINRTSDNLALIGKGNGYIHNLGLLGGLVSNTNGGYNLSSLVANKIKDSNFQDIENVYSTVNIRSYGVKQVGGLVGSLKDTIIKNSYYAGNFIDTFSINGNLSEQIGGLVGYAYGNSAIYDSYSSSSLVGKDGYFVGGIVGEISGTAVSLANSYSTSWVTGQASTVDNDNLGNGIGVLVGKLSSNANPFTKTNTYLYNIGTNGVGTKRRGNGCNTCTNNRWVSNLGEIELSNPVHTSWSTNAWDLIHRNRWGMPSLKNSNNGDLIKGQGTSSLIRFEANGHTNRSLPETRYYESGSILNLPNNLKAADNNAKNLQGWSKIQNPTANGDIFSGNYTVPTPNEGSTIEERLYAQWSN